MKIHRTKPLCLALYLVVFLWIAIFSGCSKAADTDQPASKDEASEVSEQELQDPAVIGSEGQVNTTSPEEAQAESDPVDIEAAWQTSPHASAFVSDEEGKNNACARCHAPVNWVPSMDDLPESCYSCKFELEEPPAYIPEESWGSISCNVCHPSDKDGNIMPEYSWLEIAALEEYAEVATPTDLCLKCHAPVNVREHAAVQVGGVHEGYECTECHDPHDTGASCGTADCHADVIEPQVPIPGHDADHQGVSCAACHDGTGMPVGLGETTEPWTTFATWTYEAATDGSETKPETGKTAFTSHNLVLESSCDRCHHADNPWGLSDEVSEP